MKKMSSRIRFFLILAVLLTAMLPVQANAAWKSYMWNYDAPVKAAGKWFQGLDKEMDSGWGTVIQMSRKSKKTGYVTLIEGENINNGFVTDGKKIYYVQNNILKCYTISSKKTVSLKKLYLPTKDSYYTINGCYNGKIWFVCRKEKYIGKRMVAWDIKKSKLQTVKKNFLIWNTPALTQYSVMTTNKKALSNKKDAVYTLKVFNKKNGTYKTFAKKAKPMIYASGGSYGTMAKWFIYGQYDEEGECWKIRQYTFKTGKTVTLKTLKKGASLGSLMYTGSGVALMDESGGGEFKKENMIKAK